jgi:hypothetical protein
MIESMRPGSDMYEVACWEIAAMLGYVRVYELQYELEREWEEVSQGRYRRA